MEQVTYTDVLIELPDEAARLIASDAPHEFMVRLLGTCPATWRGRN